MWKGIWQVKVRSNRRRHFLFLSSIRLAFTADIINLIKCYLNQQSICLICFVHVQLEKKRSWFNLAAQEIQPLYYYEQDGQGWLRSRGCPEDAWNGGSSLMLDGLIPAVCASPVCAKCVSAHSLPPSPTVTSLNTQVLCLLGSSPSMSRCFLRLWWGSSTKLLMGSQSLWSWRRHRLVFANAQTTMLVNVRYNAK